jgi:hypothetical protein
MTRTLKITGWLLMLIMASLIALASLRYFFLRPEVASGPPLGEHFVARLPLLLAHVLGGVVALSLGPWQFWTGLRNKYLRAHRWVGRVYLCAILLGGIAGLSLAVMAFGGLVTQTGFGGLALLWLTTGVMAYVRVRQGDFEAHREWMIRNYALTFAAVMLRLWLPLMIVAGLQFIAAYTIVAWLCWVPNLLIAELYLRSMKVRKKRAVIARGYAV